MIWKSTRRSANSENGEDSEEEEEDGNEGEEDGSVNDSGHRKSRKMKCHGYQGKQRSVILLRRTMKFLRESRLRRKRCMGNIIKGIHYSSADSKMGPTK
ncbi:hypothetical protein Tco_0460594 [Tanacetum coccineum]